MDTVQIYFIETFILDLFKYKYKNNKYKENSLV